MIDIAQLIDINIFVIYLRAGIIQNRSKTTVHTIGDPSESRRPYLRENP